MRSTRVVVVALVLGGLLSSWDGGGWVRSAGAAANAAAAGTAEKRSWGKAAVRLVVRPVQRVRLAYHFWQLKRAGDAAKVKARAAKIAAVGKRALEKGTFTKEELAKIFGKRLLTPLDTELNALVAAPAGAFAASDDWKALDQIVDGLASAGDGPIGWRLDAAKVLREGLNLSSDEFSVGADVSRAIAARLATLTSAEPSAPIQPALGTRYPFAAPAEAALLVRVLAARGQLDAGTHAAQVGDALAASVRLALAAGTTAAEGLLRNASGGAAEGAAATSAAAIDVNALVLALKGERARSVKAAEGAAKVAALLPAAAQPLEFGKKGYPEGIGAQFDAAVSGMASVLASAPGTRAPITTALGEVATHFKAVPPATAASSTAPAVEPATAESVTAETTEATPAQPAAAADTADQTPAS